MIFVIVIVIDQISKYLVRFFGGFYICNPNISFGIILPPPIFWSLWTTIIMLLLYLYALSRSVDQKLRTSGILLLLGGAVSNIIDRLAFGCVIDIIDLKLWPVFNLADTLIVIGAIIIVLSSFRDKT